MHVQLILKSINGIHQHFKLLLGVGREVSKPKLGGFEFTIPVTR